MNSCKIISVFFAYFAFMTINAQDTTLLIQFQDGGKLIEIRSPRDTIQISYYSENKIESTIERNAQTNKIHYVRYYRNGNKMWDKQLVNSISHGNCLYYNTSGKKVAEFIYVGGSIRDTVFLAPKTHLLFGKLSYSSIVYGGMENEDGTSNVSETSGPYMHSHMKFISIETNKSSKPLKEYYFTSDFNGDFFVILPSGKYGLFDKNFDQKTLQNGQYVSEGKAGMSWNSQWDLRGPVIIDPNVLILHIEFTHSSVGYAP